MAYIYLITNLKTNEKYVGQTKNSIYVRFASHIHDYKRFPQRKLYQNMIKYGVNNFDIKELEECDESLLNEREIYWISKLNTYHNGLNETPGGSLRKTSIDRDIEIIKYYNEVKNFALVQQKFNLDRTTIRKILQNNDITIQSSSESLQKLYGKPINRIDIETGVILETYPSQMAAGRWLKDNGLSNISDLRKLSYHLGQACKKHIKLGGFYWSNDSSPQKQINTNLEEIISREDLKKIVRIKPFTQIGKIYGVSDKTISNWCKKYNLPSTKREITIYSDEEWNKL